MEEFAFGEGWVIEDNSCPIVLMLLLSFRLDEVTLFLRQITLHLWSSSKIRPSNDILLTMFCERQESDLTEDTRRFFITWYLWSVVLRLFQLLLYEFSFKIRNEKCTNFSYPIPYVSKTSNSLFHCTNKRKLNQI